MYQICNTIIKYIILPCLWTIFIPLIIVIFNLVKTNFNTDSDNYFNIFYISLSN